MDERIKGLTDRIRETSYAVHSYHRNGHLEKIYENALAHRLDLQGIRIQQQYPITVRDEDGFILGEYFADILVEDFLIIELKACKALADEHTAQILGYMRGTGIEHGVLVNFGAPKLEIKKYILHRED